MPDQCLRVAHAIALRISPKKGERLAREPLLKSVESNKSTFRSAASGIGAFQEKAGLRFFDSSVQSRIAFGPGAGLAVGISVGAQTVRAVLVDANGWTHHCYETSERVAGQLTNEPALVLGRIKHAAGQIVAKAFEDPELLVEGKLPLLGWSVAWPSLIDQQRKPVGRVLAHHSWHNGQTLDQRVVRALPVPGLTTYAIPDAHAAAIAVAHEACHQPGHADWGRAQLTLVLRLAGNVSGGWIIVEPDSGEGPRAKSGFIKSILLAGVDNHAGQLGHVPVSPQLVEELERSGKAKGLGGFVPQCCTCTLEDEGSPSLHLEAYASVQAVTRRLYPELQRQEALDRLLDDMDDERHRRALTDIGALVGDALIAPVAAVNPARIVLTGSLAVPIVEEEIVRRLDAAHKFGPQPNISSLKDEENRYGMAKGAALALVRGELYRKFKKLLSSDRDAPDEIVKLTTLLESNPF
jgi:predicted NBD/HSP70 family sugar kinase